MTDNTVNKSESRDRYILLSLGILLIVTVLISLVIGRYGISLHQMLDIIQSWITGKENPNNHEAEVVISIIRVPRILLAILVGAALSASGAAYQGLFKNPMVSPDLLGVSAGAGVGASIALLLSFSYLGVQLMAFVFGLGAVFLVLGLSSAIGRGNGSLLIMVLAGTVISALFASFTSLAKYLADADAKLPELTFWLMGSFAKSGSYKNVLVLLIIMLITGLPLFLLRWKINVLSFGEEEAQAMGVNTKRLTIIIILCSTMLTASSVALCGMISWVGLIMPHIARLLVGPNYKSLLPTAMLGGSVFMLAVDNIARSLIAGEIPIGVLTSMIGAPIFIYLLFKGRRSWV
ncbi:MAG: iron ABC transporter permease [Syntrophomonas sp.]|nr:iron ABC transporter permease [Syntrophomonas sp.]